MDINIKMAIWINLNAVWPETPCIFMFKLISVWPILTDDLERVKSDCPYWKNSDWSSFPYIIDIL